MKAVSTSHAKRIFPVEFYVETMSLPAVKVTEDVYKRQAKICRELMREADGSVVGVGMAIPGPFDYENGISRMPVSYTHLYT